MTIQSLTEPNQRNSHRSFSASTNHKVEPSYKVSPKDFGMEINELELADELSVLHSISPSSQVVHEINREPFETTYQWFLA